MAEANNPMLEMVETEQGTQVTLPPDDGAILFLDGGIQYILPKNGIGDDVTPPTDQAYFATMIAFLFSESAFAKMAFATVERLFSLECARVEAEETAPVTTGLLH